MLFNSNRRRISLSKQRKNQTFRGKFQNEWRIEKQNKRKSTNEG